jgi:hypothetical protein
LERRENHLSRRILRSMVILRNRQTLPAVSSAAAMKR